MQYCGATLHLLNYLTTLSVAGATVVAVVAIALAMPGTFGPLSVRVRALFMQVRREQTRECAKCAKCAVLCCAVCAA